MQCIGGIMDAFINLPDLLSLRIGTVVKVVVFPVFSSPLYTSAYFLRKKCLAPCALQ